MMQDPTRLVDDEQIPERVRQRLRQAAASPWASVDTERGLARLAGALEADAAAAAAAAAAGKSVWKPWALVASGGTVGVLAVGGALLLVAPSLGTGPSSSARLAQAPVVASSASEPAVAPSTPEPAAAPSALEPPTAASEAAAEPPTPIEPSARKATSPAAASHADEVAHLAKARALAASDPRAALRLADEGHRTFARGILYPEREALAIDCLRRSGRSGEAKARAQRFVKRFPRSPFAERMRQENAL